MGKFRLRHNPLLIICAHSIVVLTIVVLVIELRSFVSLSSFSLSARDKSRLYQPTDDSSGVSKSAEQPLKASEVEDSIQLLENLGDEASSSEEINSGKHDQKFEGSHNSRDYTLIHSDDADLSTPPSAELQWVPQGLEWAAQVYRSRYSREPPKLFKEWFKFARENRCELEDWDYVDQLLERFREAGGISKNMLEVAKGLQGTSVCRVKNGRLEPVKCGHPDVVLLMEPAVRVLPDGVEIVFNDWDEARVVVPKRSYSANMSAQEWATLDRSDQASVRTVCRNVKAITENVKYHGSLFRPGKVSLSFDLIPVFSSATIADCFADIVVPSMYAASAQMNAQTIANVPEWENKTSKIFWRGSSTSGIMKETDKEGLLRFHRLRFVDLLQNSKDIHNADVGITTYLQCDEPACIAMKQIWGLAPYVQFSDGFSHKYLADVDGNSFSLRYLYFYAMSKSLIFKISLYSDWIFNFARPWIHYIPVSMRMDDLKDKIMWAMKNDQKAQEIAHEGFLLGSNRLRHQDMQCYWFRVLVEYAHLLQVEAK